MKPTESVSYKNTKIVIKELPKSGEDVQVFVRPTDSIDILKDIDKATYQIVGGDVVLKIPDGGTLTFVSMGLLAFTDNDVTINFPTGSIDISDILSQIDEVKETPIESVVTDDFVKLTESFSDREEFEEVQENDNFSMILQEAPPEVEKETLKNIKEDSSKPEEETPTNDFDAVYKPTDDNPVNVNISDVNNAVEAGLKFSIDLFQTQKIEDTTTTPDTINGGGGSEYGGAQSTPEAQFQSEKLDYSQRTDSIFIQTDNPDLFDDTGNLSRTIRIKPEQPAGFAISDITISGLPNGYSIVGATPLGNGSWNIPASTDGTVQTGFILNPVTGAADFVIKYLPEAVGTRIDAVFSFTTTFDKANLLPGQNVDTPDVTQLDGTGPIQFVMHEIRYDYLPEGNDPGGAIDYVDLAGDAFVLATNANYNVVITSQGDSTVVGAVGKDTIYGLQGDDTLSGALGEDTLSGGLGSNILDGGDGIDTVDYSYVTGTGAVVNLGTGVGTAPGAIDTLQNIENIKGSDFNDTLTGDANVNVIYGAAGKDMLDGGAGDDTLYGESGDDTLIGGFGDDYIDGGLGRDIIDFSTEISSVVVVLKADSDGTAVSNQGTDTIRNIEDITGSDYDDTITGSENSNLLVGGDGLDTIYGGDGDDSVDGGLKSDALFGGSGNDILHGNEDDDVLQGEAGVDELYGDGGADTLDGGIGNDTLDGGTENDTLYGNEGNDQLLGSDGDDSLNGNSGDDTLDGGVGSDRLFSGQGDDLFIGGDGIDVADYSDQENGIKLNLAATTDQVEKFTDIGDAAGSDTFTELSGTGATALYDVEEVVGSSFVDTMLGNDTSNTLRGNGGDDIIAGGAGNDALYGDKNSDTLEGGAGDDSIDGGSGEDFVDYSNDPLNGVVGVSVDLTTNSAVDGYGNTDTLTSIENVQGSTFDDVIKGDVNENTLLGGTGEDTFLATAGSDSIDGGIDADTINFSTPEITGGVLVDLSDHSATKGGVAINYTINNIENIIGTDFEDTIYGDSGKNILTGGLSRDLLYGNEESDTLVGEAGNDTLFGGDDDDSLDGGDGADRFIGGAGDDTITGGAGTDTVDYRNYDNGTQGVNIDMHAGQGGTDNRGFTDLFTDDIENLYGSSRDDIVVGSDGDNYIYAYEGNDSLDGGIGNDNLHGAQGNDSIFGNTGNDRLYGEDNNDILVGGEGDDTLDGGRDNDTLEGGTGDDILDGNTGVDTATYENANAGVSVDLSLTVSQAVGADQGSDTLNNIENIDGSKFDDTLSGSVGRNSIFGNDGDDTLLSSSENDTYNGGSGVDTLDFSPATNLVIADLSLSSNQVINDGFGDKDSIIAGTIEVLKGSTFDDTLSGDANANTFIGNSGSDQLYGKGGDDSLDGGGDDDFLDGGSGDDILDGGTGNDNLYGGSGNDSLIGDGAGNDTAYYFFNDGSGRVGSGVTASLSLGGTSTGLDGDGGTDIYTNIDNITGSRFNDILEGDGNTNILNGVTGNDSLSGLAGVDTLYGGDGNDSLSGGADNDRLEGGSGVDTLEGGIGNDAEFGQGGNDTFIAGDGSDTLDGGSHDINGGDWVDYSQSGSQGISGNLTGSMSDAFGATDTLSNIEHLIATDLVDVVTGNTEDNTILTLAGNDTVTGSAGDDNLDGGADNDWIDYSAATSSVKVDLAISGVQQIIGGGMDIDTLTNFENLIGADVAGSDTLQGSSVANTIYAKDGDDTLYGAGGNDALYGGDNATDTGVDTVDYTDAASNIIIDLDTGGGSGTASKDGDGGVDTLFGIENVIGAANGSDTITGDSGVNILDGLGGSDEIHGDAGDDIIYGRNDNDKLFGDADNDTLYGGASSDTLTGGAGSDKLYGEEDDDLLIADSTGGDSFDGGSEIDTLDYSATDAGVTLTLNGATAANVTRVNGAIDEVKNIENVTGSTVIDIISGDGLANILDGNSGADTLDGGAGDDTLLGGGDNDSLIGGSGNDTLKGELGNDTIIYNGASEIGTDVVDGGGGTDSVFIDSSENYDLQTASLDNVEVLKFTDNAFAQTATIDVSQISKFNTYEGNAGAQNTLEIKTTNTNVDISSGVGFVNVENTIIDNTLGSATTNIIGNAGTNDTVYGGSGSDIVTTLAGDDEIYANDGDDTIKFSTADLNSSDIVDGGTGNDTLEITDQVIDNTPATADNLADADLTGMSGVETIQFADVVNSITLNQDTIKLQGGNNNDTFNYTDESTFSSADTIDGGIGEDTLHFTNAVDFTIAGSFAGVSSVEVLDLSDNVNIVNVDGMVNSFETILGGTGVDSITTNGGENSVLSGDGNDTVFISSASDTLDGGNGTDELNVTGSVDLSSSTVINFENIKADDLQLSVKQANGATINVTNTLSIVSNDGATNMDAGNITASKIAFTSGVTDATTVTNIKSNIDGSNDGSNGVSVGLTLVTSDAIDTIIGGTGADTLTLNAGGDITTTFNSVETLNINRLGLDMQGKVSDVTTLNVTAGNSVALLGSDLIDKTKTLNATAAGTVNVNDISSVNAGFDAISIDNGTLNLTATSGATLNVTGLTQAAGSTVNLIGVAGSDEKFIIDSAVSSIDGKGEATADTLNVFGTVDLTSTTITDIESITLEASSLVTMSSTQVDSKTLTGAGTLHIADNTSSPIDMSNIDVSTTILDATIGGDIQLDGAKSNIDASNLTTQNVILNVDAPLTYTTGGGTNTVNDAGLSGTQTVVILGDDTVSVNLIDGNVDASGATGSVNAVNGTGSNDIKTGEGDDTYTFNGDAQVGDSIVDTGTADSDAILVTATADLKALSVSGVEILEVSNSSTTATINKALAESVTTIRGTSSANDRVIIDLNSGEDLTLGTKVSALTDVTINTVSGGGTTIIGASSVKNIVNLVDGVNDVTLGSGDDTLNGGSGKDTVRVGTGSDVVNTGADDDRLEVNVATLTTNDFFDGGTGNNTLSLTGGGGLSSTDLTNLRNFNTIETNDNNITELTLIDANNVALIDATGMLTSGTNKLVVDTSAESSDVIVNGGGNADNITIGLTHQVSAGDGNDVVNLNSGGIYTKNLDGGNNIDSLNINGNSTSFGGTISNFERINIDATGADLTGKIDTNVADIDVISGDVRVVGSDISGKTIELNETGSGIVNIDSVIAATDFSNIILTQGTVNITASLGDTVNITGLNYTAGAINLLGTDGGDETFVVDQAVASVNGGTGGSDTLTLNTSSEPTSVVKIETINVKENITLNGTYDGELANIIVADAKTLTMSADKIAGLNVTDIGTDSGNIVVSDLQASSNLSTISLGGTTLATVTSALILTTANLNGFDIDIEDGNSLVATDTQVDGLKITDSGANSALTVNISSSSGADFSQFNLDGTTSSVITLNFSNTTTFTGTLGSNIDVINLADGDTLDIDASKLNGQSLTFNTGTGGTLNILNATSALDLDQIIFTGSSAVNITGTTAVDTLHLAIDATSTYSGSMTVNAGDNDDVITNNNLANTLNGEAGDDTFKMATVTGSTINGGTTGESSGDTADYSIGSTALTFTLNANPTLTDGSKTDTLNSIENFKGSSVDDIFNLSTNFSGTIDGSVGTNNVMNISGANIDISGATILNIQTINVASGNSIVISEAQADTLVITGSGTVKFDVVDGANIDIANITTADIVLSATNAGTVALGSVTSNVDAQTFTSTQVLEVSTAALDLTISGGASTSDKITYTGAAGTYTGTLVSIEQFATANDVSMAATLVDGKTIDFTAAGDIRLTGLSATVTTDLDSVTSSGGGIVVVDIASDTTYNGTLNASTTFNVGDTATLTATAALLDGVTVTDSSFNATPGDGVTATAVTALETTPSADLSNIVTDTVTADWNGTATFAGTLGNASVTISGGVMSSDGARVDGKTISGAGTLTITDSGDTTLDVSNITTTPALDVNITDAATTLNGVVIDVDASDSNKAITINTAVADKDFTGGSASDGVNFSGSGVYSGALVSIETFTTANATSIDASILDGKTIDFDGAGNITITGMTGSENLTGVTSTGGGTLIADIANTINFTGTLSADIILNLSADSAQINATAAKIDGIKVTDSSTNTVVAITALDATLTADLSNIAADSVTAAWSTSPAGTFTGDLGVAAVSIAAGEIMIADAGSITSETISGGTLEIVNTTSGAGSYDLTNITSAVTANLDNGATTLSGVGVNVDASNSSSAVTTILTDITGLTINTGSSGNDIVNATALSDLKSVTVLGSDNVTVNLTNGDVDASGMSGTPVVTVNGGTGSNDIKTAGGADIINLSSGDDTVATGSGSDTVNIDGNNLDLNDVIDAGTGDTDILNITANGTIADIDFTQLLNFNTLNMTVNADSVELSSEAAGAFEAGSTVNGLAGDDNFTIDFSNLGQFTIDGGSDSDSVITSGGTLDASGNTTLGLNADNIETLDISSLNITNTSATEHLQITQSDIEAWTDTNDDISLLLSSSTQDSDVELVNARIQGSSDAFTNIILTTANDNNSYEFDAAGNVTLTLGIA